MKYWRPLSCKHRWTTAEQSLQAWTGYTEEHLVEAWWTYILHKLVSAEISRDGDTGEAHVSAGYDGLVSEP